MNKNKGIDIVSIQNNYERTIMKLEKQIFKSEQQLQNMLKYYSNSIKTINKFTTNEESLLLTIKNIGITTGERDQNLLISRNNQLELQNKYNKLSQD